jgi:hypothetical protein
MSKYPRQFPVMVGCKLSFTDADKLEALAQLTGINKSMLMRELVRRARAEDLAAPVCDAPDEVSVS